MKASARRTGVHTKRNGDQRHKRFEPRKSTANLVEHLETRVLLTTTGAVVWNGISQSAVVGEYILRSPLIGNVQQQITASGLQVAGVRSLGYGYFQLYDYADSVAKVNQWAVSHVGMASLMAPNHVMKATAIPSEMTGAASTNFWYYNNTGQVVTSTGSDQSLGIPATQAGIPGADIDALRAWNLTTGSANTIVAVLDTGIDYNQADFANRLYSNANDPWTTFPPAAPSGDGVDNDLDGVIDDFHGANFSGTGNAWDPFDGNGHGTLVSGLIAAQGNGAGPNLGVNWQGQILPVKVVDNSGAGTHASVIAGINYVILLKRLRGVNITTMNMSLGRQFIGPASGVGDPAVAAIFDAIDRAGQAGIIVVVAAGNDGLNLDQTGVSPGSHSNQLMLTVAATDNRDNGTIFTNFGTLAQLAAPGQSITGIGPDNGGSGTSFAAPLVTGAVALLHSLVPNASPGQIVDAILRGVDVRPQLANVVSTSGRLNVFHSLELLMGNVQATGHVDIVNSTQVVGWLYDANAGSDAIFGQLFIDGKYVSTFLANQNRADLGPTLGSTQHGFTVSLPVLSGSGQHTIQIVALDVVPMANGEIRRFITTPANPHAPDNTNSVYNSVPVNIPITEGGTSAPGGGVIISGNVPPTGFVDSADRAHIVGWAFDVQAGNLPVNIQVYIDGLLAATGVADQNRPDLERLRLGSINHGFDIPTPGNLSIGPHRVSVYALDSTTGARTLIGSRTLLENAPLAYFVDNVPGSSVFTGYVYNPDNINQTVQLEIAIDSKQYAYFPIQANEFRADVPVPNQNHGFTITIPPLFGGGHFVSLTAYNPATGESTVIAARNLGSDTPPYGSLAVNNNTLSGFTYDIDTGGTNLYRVDVDGQIGNVFTSNTQGTANQQLTPAPTPGAPGLPSFPVNGPTLDITQFGAQSIAFGANGATAAGTLLAENTFAIQTAINNVSAAGGGTVYIGAGYWISNQLILRSNVNLFLDVGAILAPPARAAYNGGNRGFLYGNNITNFQISGSGTINGLSASWTGANIPPLLQLDASNRIRITGVDFANFSGTAMQFGAAVVSGQLRPTHDVTIDDISTDFRNLTNDQATAVVAASTAIAIQGGHDFLIQNCTRNLITPTTSVIQTGLNAGQAVVQITAPQVAATAIHITNNTFSRGNGVTNGANTVNGVDDVVVDNNLFNGSAFAIRILSTAGTGGTVQNIYAHDLAFSNNVGTAISVVATGNRNNNVPLFQNLIFRDFHNTPLPALAGFVAGSVGTTAVITGLANEPIAGISLYNIDFVATRGVTVTNAIGFYMDASVIPVLPANAVLLTTGNTISFGDDAHYYQFATPHLSAGFHTFTLYTFDPINGDVKLIRSTRLLVPANSPTNTQPVGAIVTADANSITGYAIDPNTSAPINVEVQVDGVVVSTRLANVPRPNLPVQFGPNHGFAMTLPNLSNGRHVITVYAIDAADPSIRTLVGSTVVTKGLAPSAVIQLARADYIVAKAFGFANFNSLGWVFRITVDGRTGNTIPASTLGPINNGLATLAFKTPAIDPTVAHTISIEYIDPITQVPTTLASAVIPATRGVVGRLTLTNNNFIGGYAFSTLMPEKSLPVLLTADGQLIRQVTANAVLPNVGAHGFTFSTLGVPAGTHLVSVLAIDPASGLYVSVGSFVVTIPEP